VAEYFPFARIVGLDIYRKDIAISPRVTILQGSQTDEGLLQSIVDGHGPFDLVIDDGSHVVHDVLTTFRFLYPRLSPEGIYIVEDTLTAFHDRTGGSPNGAGTIFTLAHALSLAMHCPEGHEVGPEDAELAALGAITRAVGFHRNLIVFERGDNGYPVNFGPHFRLDIDDPRVREIYDSIEAEAARNPSSRSSLSRIGMRIWARQTDKAAALALEAAARYPEDGGLLAELVQLMAWAGRHDIAEAIEARLGRASGPPPIREGWPRSFPTD
jgi:hypothetical protein